VEPTAVENLSSYGNNQSEDSLTVRGDCEQYNARTVYAVSTILHHTLHQDAANAKRNTAGGVRGGSGDSVIELTRGPSTRVQFLLEQKNAP
jgi:hypothetical protein